MPLQHEVIEYLSTIAIVEDQVDQERLKTSVAELDEYRNFHARRLLRSLELIQKWRPIAAGPKILELGAAPYYFTALLYRYFPDCQLIGANVRARLEEDSASAARPEKVTLQHGSGGHRNELPVYVFNVETANYPFPTASFDWVLCMELIEHLAYSPTHMLAEAHRVLRPGGRLLLTTPNAVDLRKTLDFLFNRAPGFRYSGYGIYGRHNREFTVSELCALVEACGYRVLEARLENVILRPHYSRLRQWLFKFVNFWTELPLPYLHHKREWIFIVAESIGSPQWAYPSWLYAFPHLYPARGRA